MTICKHGTDSTRATCGNCQNERHYHAGLKTRKFMARFVRWAALSFGHWDAPGAYCACCGIHEAVCPQHDVMTNEHSGTAILCEGCWRDLSTDSKVKCYRDFYEKYWAKSHSVEWQEIELAVRYPYHWRNPAGFVLQLIDQDHVELPHD